MREMLKAVREFVEKNSRKVRCTVQANPTAAAPVWTCRHVARLSSSRRLGHKPQTRKHPKNWPNDLGTHHAECRPPSSFLLHMFLASAADPTTRLHPGRYATIPFPRVLGKKICNQGIA
eukprot:6464758-Amphidinium_carterae.1